MRTRSVPLVVVFTWITLGIYALYWMVSTKNEMNQRGAQIPTAWLLIIPFVNIWWLWKYSEGVELVTQKQMTTPIAFIMMFVVNGFIAGIGSAILQNSYNAVGETAPQVPEARVA